MRREYGETVLVSRSAVGAGPAIQRPYVMLQKVPKNLKTQPQILSPEESAFWREAYLDAFVDTASEHYRRYIASPRSFSDGPHYEGYLWDCLRSPTRITIERFRHEIEKYPEVLVMADDHSRNRIPGAPLWPYPSLSVARFTPRVLVESLAELPEDLYLFDESVSWTLGVTHEHDGKRRICFAAKATLA